MHNFPHHYSFSFACLYQLIHSYKIPNHPRASQFTFTFSVIFGSKLIEVDSEFDPHLYLCADLSAVWYAWLYQINSLLPFIWSQLHHFHQTKIIQLILFNGEQIIWAYFWFEVNEVIVWSGCYHLDHSNIILFIQTLKYKWFGQEYQVQDNSAWWDRAARWSTHVWKSPYLVTIVTRHIKRGSDVSILALTS
jgi:hypothetical protein